jgi:ribosomal protein S18 acetylase RimI-like enzyme
MEERAEKCIVGRGTVLAGEGAGGSEMLELPCLYVLYHFHGLGLGKALTNVVIEHAQANGHDTVTLRVNAKNESATGFYGHFGFEVFSAEAFRAGSHDHRELVMRSSICASWRTS